METVAVPGDSTPQELSPADIRRQQIVDIAASMFDERGYHDTSIADLAVASGLAKPTFYHYFTSKSEVLKEIHNAADRPLSGRMRSRLESDESPTELVRATVHDILSAMVEHRSHLRVFFEHHRELEPEDRRNVRAKRREYEEGLVEIIKRGIATGEFRDVDPHVVALAVFGMCNWSYQWLPRGVSAAEAAKVAEQLLDFAFDGLLADDDSAAR